MAANATTAARRATSRATAPRARPRARRFATSASSRATSRPSAPTTSRVSGGHGVLGPEPRHYKRRRLVCVSSLVLGTSREVSSIYFFSCGKRPYAHA